jgi:glyoxylase-like metal-dependent hydrolase (beta-lactamase superfamily II)
MIDRRPAMKGLEFVFIPGGFGENDGAYNFMGTGFATADTKKRQDSWMRFPLPYGLIKHPELGYIMYDVGLGPGEEADRRPLEHRMINPTIVSREDYVDERLKQLGLTVNDITVIILSHCHWDHMGGLEFFRETKAIQNIYVSKKDFAHGLVMSHRTAKGYSGMDYYKKNMDVEGAEFCLLDDEDIELFPGIQLLMLPGHTPCVIGLLLKLESGVYILPSDSVTAEICLRDPLVMPGSLYDSVAYLGSVKKLRKLEKQYDAKFLFQHDPFNYPKYQMMTWIK